MSDFLSLRCVLTVEKFFKLGGDFRLFDFGKIANGNRIGRCFEVLNHLASMGACDSWHDGRSYN